MLKKHLVLLVLTGASLGMLLAAISTDAAMHRVGESQTRTEGEEKPDLLVEKIEITSEPMLSGKAVLNIAYTIYNDSSVPTKCCPTEAGKSAWKNDSIMANMFQAGVQAREFPEGEFYEIEIGTSAIKLGPNEKETFYATEIFSQKMQWEFRIIADPGNWIEERNEKNNQKKQVWPQEDCKE